MNTSALLFGIVAVIEAGLVYWTSLSIVEIRADLQKTLELAQVAQKGWRDSVALTERAMALQKGVTEPDFAEGDNEAAAGKGFEPILDQEEIPDQKLTDEDVNAMYEAEERPQTEREAHRLAHS